jgi:hypothetical protein
VDVRFSVATAALRDAAGHVDALRASIADAALDTPPVVVEASSPLAGSDLGSAAERLAHAAAGALDDLATALLELAHGLTAAAEGYEQAEARALARGRSGSR